MAETPYDPLKPNPLTVALRNIGVTVLGLFAGGLVVYGLESLSSQLGPMATPEQMHDPLLWQAYLNDLSPSRVALVLAAYAIAPFTACYLATRLAATRTWVNAFGAGGLFMAMLIVNFYTLPHPTWFIMFSFGLALLGALMGYRVGDAVRRDRV